MINVTYAITVCNELTEITTLIDFLKDKIGQDDEILIQYDSDSATDAVKAYLDIISQIHASKIKIIGFPLNKDFASYKNNLKNHAKGIFIFQIDADETPTEYMVENIHELLEYNKDVDLFFVPRINTVTGLTNQHIKKWGWKVDEKEWSMKKKVQWVVTQMKIWKKKILCNMMTPLTKCNKQDMVIKSKVVLVLEMYLKMTWKKILIYLKS